MLFIPISASPQVSANNKHALLIGIDNYKYVSHLTGQVADVEAVREFLKSYRGYVDSNIQILVNEQATRGAIESALRELIKNTKANDQVFFYFTGHGYQVEDEVNGDELDGLDEALVTYDASNKSDTNPMAFLKMLDDDHLNDWLSQLNDRHVEVVIDACHSGTATKAPTLPSTNNTPVAIAKRPTFIKHATNEKLIHIPKTKLRPIYEPLEAQNLIEITPMRKVWSASEAYEISFVDNRDPNNPKSVFTHALLKGMREGKQDHELLQQVQKESHAFCEWLRLKRDPSIPACGSLTPRLDFYAHDN